MNNHNADGTNKPLPRQISIRSSNFVLPGDIGEPDAYLSNEDRAALGLPIDPSQPHELPPTPLPRTEPLNHFETPRPRPMQVSKK